jgi:CBS domain-containing protein
MPNTLKESTMNVSKLCRRDVVTIRPYEELMSAAELMREHHVGYLVVVQPDLQNDAQKPVGVLTDRDIVVTVIARQLDPRAFRVEDVMTRDPVVVGETDSLDKALESMNRIGVRRLPVVGSRGQLVGVIALDDAIRVLADELGNVAGSIRNEQRVEGALRP